MTKIVSEILSKYEGENPGVKANLARMLNQGALGGTGKMVILPVDQGFEHGPARSFAANPDAYDPHYHYKLAIDAGMNAYAAPLGMIEAGADTFAGQIPTILKANSANSLIPKNAPFDQAITASVDDALRLGCSAIGFTIYPGSSQALSMFDQIRAMRNEAAAKGIATVIWSYPRGEDLDKNGETAIDISAYAAQVAGLLADRNRAQNDIASLQGERATLLSEQEALSLALAETRTEIDAQSEVARLAAARREALEALVADLRSQTVEQQQQAQALSSRVEELQGQLSDEETARLVEAAAAQALRDRLEDADAELTAMTMALEGQRQEAEDTLTLLAAAKATNENLDAQLLQALQQIETAQSQAQVRDEWAERLTRVLAQMEVSQSESVDTMNALEAELSRIRTESSVARAALTAELNAAQTRASDTRDALEAELAQTRAEAARTQDSLRAELAAAAVRSAAAQAELEAALSQQTAQNVQTQSQFESELGRLQAENALIRRTLEAQLATAVADAEAAQSALTAQLTQARTQAAATEQGLQDQLVNQQVASAAAEAALRAQLAQQQNEGSNRVGALESEVAGLRTDLAAARSTVQSTDQERAQTEARLLKALESL
jgi:DhnA family fructose-bisphosphate aldolase class Ia